MEKRKLIKIFALIISIFIFTGCGKEKVNYVEDTQLTSDINSTDMSVGTLREKLMAEKSWAEDFGRDINVVIQTGVEVPDVNTVKVVDAKRMIFTADDKKELLSKFTEGDIYVYPSEYENMTKEQLEKKIKDYEYIISFYEKEKNMPNTYVEYQHEYDVLMKLKEYYEDAPEEYMKATDYNNDKFKFDYKGKEYYVEFWDRGVTFAHINIPCTGNININEGEKDYQFYAYINEDSDIENICNITQEEANNEALGFVDSLGIGRFDIISSAPLKCYWGNSEQGDTWCEGYEIKLLRSIDGMLVDNRDWSCVDSEKYPRRDCIDQTFLYGYGYEQIVVWINDAGVTRFAYLSPMELGKVTSSEVPLLTYDNIQDVIREEILLQECYKGTVFNNMCLRYLPIKDEEKEGNYSIIPVWMLTRGDEKGTSSCIVVNAIDGSIINMFEQCSDDGGSGFDKIDGRDSEGE